MGRAIGEGDGVEPLRSVRIELDDDALELYELSLRDGWGDGLPLIAPTEERVRALLAATPRPAGDVVAALPPCNGVATIEKVAVNAAMTGVEPAAFGHVLAALTALVQPDHNLLGLTTTTSSATSVFVVNGPHRRPLGFDYEAGCLGSAAGRGSTTVGRAVQLCLRNIGGQRPGATSQTVFGLPSRVVGTCFAEWEERSPWPSLAVQRGAPAATDAVSVHAAKGFQTFADGNTSDERELLWLVAKTVAYPLGNAFHGPAGRGETVLLVNPMWADRFARAIGTVDDVRAVLHEHAWQPIEQWPPSARRRLEATGRVGPGGRVAMHDRPEQFVPVVCGGLGNLQALAMPTWGDSRMQTVVVGAATGAAEAGGYERS
jgi:hypothetical protein